MTRLSKVYVECRGEQNGSFSNKVIKAPFNIPEKVFIIAERKKDGVKKDCILKGLTTKVEFSYNNNLPMFMYTIIVEEHLEGGKVAMVLKKSYKMVFETQAEANNYLNEIKRSNTESA